jgi:hypothetical protein
VREPERPVGSSILVQVPVNTWEAYNRWGGKSLYDFYGPRAYRVSFDRPFGDMAQTPMWWEIQLVRFLEREGYDVSYQTDLDTDRNPGSLLRHRAVLVAGHDEYWTSGIREAFDAALAEGTNLAFMGSNDGYWRIKYADDRRTIFGYKSLYDPVQALADKTAMFREIGSPECMLMGVLHQFLVVQPDALDYAVTDAGAADAWLAGTGFAPGDTITGVVGREHDVINPFPASCFHPGLTVLFHYDGHGIDQNGDAVRFTAPSGTRVFASGAQQFAGRSTTGGVTRDACFRSRRPSRGAASRSTRGSSNSCAMRSTTSRGRRLRPASPPAGRAIKCRSRCRNPPTRVCSVSSQAHGSATAGSGSATARRAVPALCRRASTRRRSAL